ncbi:hypothetical protein NEU95_001516, partial [Salmonella enterica]|nr:hypothetical protein [Salmonella enterica]
MARQKKTVEVPGQESAPRADAPRADEQTVQQRVANLLDDAALAERNTLLGTINEQGAAI